MTIIITSPSLDVNNNVTGISAITNFIIDHNQAHNYVHFELGRKDEEKRNLTWVLRMINTYFKWCHLLFTTKNSLIHFNIALTKPSIIRDIPLILIARLFRHRMVIHLHGGEYLSDQDMPTWMRKILKFSFSGNNPKIVLSPLEKVSLKHRLAIDNIFVLPNCVDLTVAKSFERDHSNRDMLKLLFLGRISEKKGLEYIYLALKELKKEGVNFKFLMAGKGADEERYITKFSELLGSDFEFKGVVHGVQKNNLLKDANVFLLPSFFEGLPMALIEAMSFGLASITTNVGSIKYVIQDEVNGILVKKYNAEDIVSAIKRLHADSAYLNSLSKNAQSKILKDFNPETYILKLNKLYQYE